MELKKEILKMARTAKEAALILGDASSEEKNRAIRLMAKKIKLSASYILRENKKDVKAAEKKKMKPALIDRLALNAKRIQAMVSSLEEVARLDDVVGQIIQARRRPNGLLIAKVRVPIGVIGIIYEARPNVTADCVGLCIKSGNSVILKGGSEALNSNAAIFKCLRDALSGTSIPKEAVQLIISKDRNAVKELLKLNNYIDLIMPRGGEGLIKEVTENSRIPVIKHYKGVCHVYVDEDADLNMAHKIAMNAKVQRPGVCNAMETLLVHADVVARFLPGINRDLRIAGVEIRGCKKTQAILKGVKAATEDDWYEEYLDLILAVKVVEGLDEAIRHINKYGSGHSEAIVTDDYRNATEFLARVNSACVYVNASTRFTDGYEFGMGAEIGISTDKLHARGPMGLEELTTYKYIILGNGQVRA
ncbi:MAG: glutamate-5-semialdehyde dehydrogenase [Candidatus Omnitrophica bacterium]|nr:glutamate-5-semialdehyde dehydrogenase [Candidatus Omnitrophota bacterium]MBU4488015.1 glutamate-5-semialdehyde dehydrogenase [Candidatus Omnitrophota bacterium]MCG2704743.1 glutamate-5-semialdehyde dehydrogenase [Candidatus Omnitrophota bacterium]